MECRNCGHELDARQGSCPNCGEHAPARLSVATKEPPAGGPVLAGLRDFPAAGATTAAATAEAAPTEGRLRVDDGEPLHTQPSGSPAAATARAATATAPASAKRWSPRKERVEAWAIGKQLNHYEVLDLDETATDAEINERVTLLDETLERWAVDQMDYVVQTVGAQGKHRIYELRTALGHRAEYDAELARVRKLRAAAQVREELLSYVEKDRALQWNEWVSLEMKAREAGVGEEQLEALLAEQRAQGVLTGLNVGGREVRTLLALKDRCRGNGEQLVGPIWSGEMEDWLERAADKKELAGEVRQLREEYADKRVSGASLLLWRIGEKRLVLSGNNGPEEVTSVRQFVDGVQGRGLEESALAALQDRRLENWLREAMNQESMADAAARGRDEGRKGLLDVIRQVEAQRADSFEFEHGQAYSVAELVGLCDQYADEAQGYLFDGILGSWLANRGHGPLARQANAITTEYGKKKKKRVGLELFVRELCKKANFEPYPRLVAQPQHIDLGALPVGARAAQSIRLKNEGRGYAWGTVTVEPALPGLKVTAAFDGANSALDVTLDLLEVQPGDYYGNIVIRPEGVPTPTQVPVRYQVVPLAVSFDPPAIEFGNIPHGKAEWTTLNVTCAPAHGRLVGVPSFDPSFKGLQVEGRVDGAEGQLRVTIDTTPHEPGRQYETDIYLDTNVGRFAIPVRFGTLLRWDVVASWTAGLSAATGIVLWICRLILMRAEPAFNAWFMTYRDASKNVLVTGGFLGAVVAGTAAILIAYARNKKKKAKA